MLNGHLDVVAAHEHQFDPQVRDSRIYGRGTQDMKGSVAVLMRLLKDLAARDVRPDVGVQFVSDEEIGGMDGTERLLLEEDWRCGFFIAAEPTDFRICYEQKGGVWIKLRIPGEPAHASRPWSGRNPHADLGQGLHALFARFPTPTEEAWATTVTPTVISAASRSTNQVPAYIDLNIDIRRIAADDPAVLLDAVQDCFPTAVVEKHRLVNPLMTDTSAAPVQRLADTIAQVRGTPASTYREHFGSDARFYSTAGIPAVCFGPVGAGLHSDEEWVDIDSLVELYEILSVFCTR
jgi:succinyl-diaminopimelate desuccinylase